ncbi:hypothetical protein [Phosphitispora fastidiosa]|uniref:hypothetical protein n=1 Tax=Phosphitispora fastidiosa TaxID=2837202 RepID=UPI001E32F3DB|nr:hypothetical protein [Phosphitispora fastidiosa]MBU7006311.1 hypothetical protein [Phosphitispora fastidiosa]
MADPKTPLPINQCQIFPHTYQIPCETYNCLTQSEYHIGRPDGPLSVMRNLCSDCADKLVESILATPELIERHMGRIKELVMADQDYQELVGSIREAEKKEQQAKMKTKIQSVVELLNVVEIDEAVKTGICKLLEIELPKQPIPEPKKYQCAHCDAEPFDTPQKLAAHVKKEHPKPKE